MAALENVRPHAAHGPVTYRTFVPPSPYDSLIENIWYWEGFDPGHAKDTIMASGRLGLLVNLAEPELNWYDGEGYRRRNRLGGIALCGAHSSHFAIDAFQPNNMGVQFKPGGAAAFFSGSAREFHDNHVSLADIWGGDEAERLHERLVDAPTPEAKAAVLFRALAARARQAERHPAVALALTRFERAPHRTSVKAVAREAEISVKRLIGLFADEVGMTPKAYLRVSRFQRVLARVHPAVSIDWMDEVERHGYYDQPHFIREFREFSGFTPTEYLRRRGPYLQHVAILE
jgi:AraC-like DNA-binding protein